MPHHVYLKKIKPYFKECATLNMTDDQHGDQIMQKSITIKGNFPPESVFVSTIKEPMNDG